MKIRCLLVFIVVAIASCGRGIKDDALLVSASAPPSMITGVLSGRTGNQLSSAKVSATSKSVRVDAPGYFSLQSSRGGMLYLWPVDDQLTRSFSVSLAHSEGMITRLGLYVRRVSLLLPPEITTPKNVERIQQALNVINDAQQSVHYVVNDFSSDLSIRLYFDADDPAFLKQTDTHEKVVAVAHLYYTRDGVIQSASVTFPSRAYVDFEGWFEAVLVHELGHTLGMGHTPQGTLGMMSSSIRNMTSGFTEAEKTVLAMIYHRQPGTRLTGTTEYEGIDEVPASTDVHEVVLRCLR